LAAAAAAAQGDDEDTTEISRVLPFDLSLRRGRPTDGRSRI
jgi:hypothetical protein